MKIYTYIKKLSPKSIFFYTIFICFFLATSLRHTISYNVLIFLIIAILFVVYMIERHQTNKEVIENQYTEIKKAIPFGEHLSKYPDLSEYLYSVKDFSTYNQRAYLEMIDNILQFLDICEDIKIDSNFGEYKYQILDTKKKASLNALHSIFFSLPASLMLTKKIDDAQIILKQILEKYQGEILTICQNRFIKNGHNVYTQLLNSKLYPISYTKQKFFYDLN